MIYEKRGFYMKKEKSLKALSIKAVIFSAIVAAFALFCDPLSLTFNIFRGDKVIFNFFTIAVPRYDYKPEDIALLYYGANVIIVLLVVATLVLSILALLNQKGKMVNATNGITKALKIVSKFAFGLGAFLANIVNVALGFITCGGNGVVTLIIYFVILILASIMNTTCKNYANRILPAKQNKAVAENK